MIVRLNLERTSPPIPHIDDPGVLPRPLHHAARPRRSLAARWQPLQMHPRRLIRAVLRPHDRKNPQLGQRRDTSQSSLDPRIFVRGDAVLLKQRRGNRSWGGSLDQGLNLRIGHGSLLRLSHAQPPFATPPKPHRRSSAARSHFATSAAPAYALSRNSITAVSGDACANTSSYLKMNSPNALSHPAASGRTFTSASPSGTGAA